MNLGDALKSSRTLGQAVNCSETYHVMVVETDDTLFQPNKQLKRYTVSVMRDLTTRKRFEPVYESQLGLADIEAFLRRTSTHPPPTTWTQRLGNRFMKPSQGWARLMLRRS